MAWDAGVAAARSGVAVAVSRAGGAGLAVSVLVEGVGCAVCALVDGSAAAIVSLTRETAVAAACSGVAVTAAAARRAIVGRSCGKRVGETTCHVNSETGHFDDAISGCRGAAIGGTSVAEATVRTA